MKIKFYLLISFFLFLISCRSNSKQEKDQNETCSFYVGTYTNEDSEGIYKYSLDKEGKIKQIGLSAKSKNPSFLAWSTDHKFLVAVNETDNEGFGTVGSFEVTDSVLKFINRQPTGGAHPCHVAVNEKGYVLVTNYSGGNVGLLKLDDSGKLTELLDVQQHSGNGLTDRQEAPHAHSVWFVGDDNVISVDLGTNELWFSQLDTDRKKLLPSNPQKLKMEPGAGPRHLALHPNGKWFYVVNELDCTVTRILKKGNGFYEKRESVSTLPTNFTEANYCADIHISSDGKFVYASNRGHNSIAIFRVNSNDGTLEAIAHQDVKGEWPRSFALSPDENLLVVANQYTNNIVSFKRDKNTGLLELVDDIDAPSPVCILF